MSEYIKSAIPQTGRKHKLLSQIIPLFPKNISKFYDIFTGSGDVFLNVNAQYYLANDKNTHLIRLHDVIERNGAEFYDEIKRQMKNFDLSKTNKDGYYKLRDAYNELPDDVLFYLLISHSFSNQMRFNKSNKFNLVFGGRTFNHTMQENYKKHVRKINKMNIEFSNKDFRNMDYDRLGKDDFAYIDPPYRISLAHYNENQGWTRKDEDDLLMLLDDLDSKGIRWAMSNVLEHKGKKNEVLSEFAKLYNVHYINSDYKNCNYQVKDRVSKTVEVLITNYRSGAQ